MIVVNSLLRNPNPLLPLLAIFVHFTVPASSSSHAAESAELIASCLTHHHVRNFTVYANVDNGVYFHILNFSIQNLRYAEPDVPKPIAIVLPESMEEVVKTVGCCRNGSWEIRVRSGGHGYEGTSSVAADGTEFVIIDMMNLDGVIVDLEAETAWVEGGATLGQTYYAISESSSRLGFSAGSCPTVGVGGHIAGGGFGFLSRRYGLAADNVVDAVLVDADGRVLDRRAMGEEVFWAIRGGGGGIWGIVYAWKLKLSPVPAKLTGFMVSRPGTKAPVAELVHKWQFVAPQLEEAFYFSAAVGAALPEYKDGISVTFRGLYLGPKAQAVSILSHSFPQLGITEEDCIDMTWIESMLFFSELEDRNGSTSILANRYLKAKGCFKAKSDYVRTPIPIRGIRAALDILENQPKGHIIMDPYGGAMASISSDSIAFPHRKGNLFAIQYLIDWAREDEGQSQQYLDWIRGFYDSMEAYVSWGPRAAYVNYMDLDLGVMDGDDRCVEVARLWGEKYFLDNFDRLVRAKTLVDPHNVFRHQQGIPPFSSVFSAMAEI